MGTVEVLCIWIACNCSYILCPHKHVSYWYVISLQEFCTRHHGLPSWWETICVIILEKVQRVLQLFAVS